MLETDGLEMESRKEVGGEVKWRIFGLEEEICRLKFEWLKV